MEVPGFEATDFLGSGAFGEVWVALDHNTGRRVAIKYYNHRGGLDAALLNREVEKLVFLSTDRYVVQLIEVGWDADPAYYVMEYIEGGSLQYRLRSRGPFSTDEAVTLFRELAIGLSHAHAKGILHCDLKPDNVLLDQDGKPRLADFGQSRLSHEQSPSLGTLFYMAPEQADLNAVPDACWDVYGLGAILYSMLTGSPPRKTDDAIEQIETAADLDERLLRYRKVIMDAPPLLSSRELPRLDRPLADLLERCLAIDPAARYPNVQAVLDALDARAKWRARRPLLLLGAFGPVVLLLSMGALLGWSYARLMHNADEFLVERALKSNQFAAEYVAKEVAHQLDQRFRSVERMARDSRLPALLRTLRNDSAAQELSARLSEPFADSEALEPVRERFRALPSRQPLQEFVNEALQKFMDENQGNGGNSAVASYFVTDHRGLQVARAPFQEGTIAHNYAWRSYFHGGAHDEAESWRPEESEHLMAPYLSDVFPSQATNRWVVAVSSPVHDPEDGTFLGVAALTLEVGDVVRLEGDEDQFAVLIDGREGKRQGLILEHPLFPEIVSQTGKIADPTRFVVPPDKMPLAEMPGRREHYQDPTSMHAEGTAFGGRWLAAAAAVNIGGQDSGWRLIVQQTYDAAIGDTLSTLRRQFSMLGWTALAVVGTILSGLWAFVLRGLRGNGHAPQASRPDPERFSTTQALPTIAAPQVPKPRH